MIVEACVPLVAAIEQQVSLTTPVRAAFLAIDRGHFVPSYYEQQEKTWVLRLDVGAMVYTNDALITKLDATRMPCSSSSMPSVMAVMLEALDLKPGQRVLEIGAGTGYNAALIHHLIGGSGQIISIDIDEEVIQHAQEHFQVAGIDGVLLATANGWSGYAPLAPYDRLIATAGFRRIPIAWQEQLAPDGMLVGNLIGSLASVLVHLTKQPDGSLVGNLLPQSGFFMEMRESLAAKRRIAMDWSRYDALPAHIYQGLVDLSTILNQSSFLFYLQGKRPSLCRELRHHNGDNVEHVYRYLFDPLQHSSVAFSYEVSDRATPCEIRGNLCMEILETYEQWQRLGSPALSMYQLYQGVQGDLHAEIASERWCLYAATAAPTDKI